MIDSGLEMSSEFTGRVKAFYDFTNGGIVAVDPYDDYGHGTHVAGMIGGSGALSTNDEYRGLAPKVKFVVLKVLDKNGAGYTSDVIRAVDFAVANRAALGIHIINLSLGHPIYEPASTDPLVQAVERASRAGIDRRGRGRQLRRESDDRPARLCGHHLAGQRAVGDHASARSTTLDTVDAQRRPHPGLQLGGPTWYDAFVKPDIVAPGHNIVAVGREAAARSTRPIRS